MAKQNRTNTLSRGATRLCETVVRANWNRPACILPVLMLLGLSLRVFGAAFAPNMFYPDEIFQTLEPAHRLAFGFGVVTWEWRTGIRSWALPEVLSFVMRATSRFTKGSFGYLFATEVLLSIISLTCIWFAYKWAEKVCGRAAALISASTATIWYSLVYFGPKASYETVSTHFLLPGLYLSTFAGVKYPRLRLIAAGLCYGIAGCLRVQLIPAIVVGLYWGYRYAARKRCQYIVIGLCIPAAAFGLIDLATWHGLFVSFSRYFFVNVIEGRSKLYGVEPWYWYLLQIVPLFGPLLVPVLVGARKSLPLTSLIVVVIVSHSFLAHKELRFIYTIVPLCIALTGIGCVEIARWFSEDHSARWNARQIAFTSLVLCTCTSIFLGLWWEEWTQDRGVLVSMLQLSREDNICGVGLVGVHWSLSGGYTYLHKAVPIVPLDDESDAERSRQIVNVLITSGTMATPVADFRLQQCNSGTCIYRRDGWCAAAGSRELNLTLRELNE